MIRLPLLVFASALASLIAFGLEPAVRTYRGTHAERLLIEEKAHRAMRVRAWLRRHPEVVEAQGQVPAGDEAGLIAFLQECILRSDVRLGSVRPLSSAAGRGSAHEGLFVDLSGQEGAMRRCLLFLEEARAPWRIGDIEIRAGGGKEAGVEARLTLERMGDGVFSPDKTELFLTQEDVPMEKRTNTPSSDRAFFAAPRPAALPQESSLAVLLKGWDLVGILLGIDQKAVIEDTRERRVFSVRPGDVVGGATVTAVGADSVVFVMGEDTLRLTFE